MTSESTLDGNVLAGPLRDIFSFEATTAVATCAGCGSRSNVASWAVYVDAPGIVARCTHCEKVQVGIVRQADRRMWVDLSGVATLQISA
jgi:Family of unknown function (DUF6510)